MRITSVDLRNFRIHQSTTVRLDSATVIVGGNDSGKSTLLMAVDWVFNWRSYSGDEHPFFTHHFRSGSGLVSDQDPVSVVVECEGLGERRTTVFGPLLTEGRLRFGRRALPGLSETDQAAPWVVAARESWRRLAEQTALSGDLRGQPVDQTADVVFETYVQNCVEIDGDLWMPAEAVVDVFWFHPAPDIDDLPRAADLVWLRGPDREMDTTDLLRPILREMLKRHLGDADDRRRKSWLQRLEAPIEAMRSAEYGRAPQPMTKADEVLAIGDAAKSAALTAWQAAAERVLGRKRTLEFPNDPYSRLEALVDAAIGDLAPMIDGRTLQEAGAGTRRALALAALDLYADSSLWPGEASIILMIEEPEVGLDPSAQRRVAIALSELAGHSVQTMVVTHSPIFVNAAKSSGIRILSRPRSEGALLTPQISTPYRLKEIADALGAKPADVLLARRFVVVEGLSDAAVISMWAVELGLNLGLEGIQVVDAGGYSAADTVARFIGIAYEDVPISVLLDNGSDTNKKKLELEATYGPRVQVTLLPTTEIEGCFSVDAVTMWMERSGAEVNDEIAADVARRMRNGVSKEALKHLSRHYLRRSYDLKRDGIAIAAAMGEESIPVPVKSFLFSLTAP